MENDTTPAKYKQCPKCKQIFQLSDSFYYRDKTKSSGYQSLCKACHNEKIKQRNIRRRIQKTRPVRTLNVHVWQDSPGLIKNCNKCHIDYPATPEYFQRDKNKPGGLFHTCKICCNARKPESTDINIRKICRTCGNEYPATATYFFRDKTKKFGLESNCKQCHTLKDNTPKHKLLKRIMDNNRRARKLDLPSAFTPQDWRYCLDFFDHHCAVCGKPAGLWHFIAADHWIPIASPDCPGTIPTNVVPLCHSRKDGEGSCNNLKSDKEAVGWLKEQFGERKAKAILQRINAYFHSLALPGDK